ncbi:hypothetical protein J4464_01080 [Candidatus Woesearchaeota archaeon]|nr:hypothetical protein [Candidatus Woesearchaeota archaeon]
MKIKEFFKPTAGKFVWFALLMGGLNYLYISTIFVADAIVLLGLPFGFWPKGSFMRIPGLPNPVIEFSWVNFILDIAFWYVISCGIVVVYHKMRGK